ncbi:MAG: hypothetical protein RLZ10_1051 [Bacteroidota bacterium]
MRLPNSYDTTTFNELIFVNHPMGAGVQCIVQYPNGYGASVVKGEHTYGGKNGLYELAVFGKDGHITYDTPITDDVLGHLTEQDVEKILNDIKNLKDE